VTTVSTAVCGWFQDILEGAGCAVAGLWDDLPVDPQRFAEAGPSLGWDDFARLCERFEQRFDGREALLAATRRTAQAYYEAGARVFTGGFGDPRQLYWVAHRWVRPAAFPAFTSEFRDLPNGQIHITLAGPVDASVPAFVFEMIQAALVDVPRLIGQPAANVTAHLAPGRADYTIAWAVGPVDDAHLREMLDSRRPKSGASATRWRSGRATVSSTTGISRRGTSSSAGKAITSASPSRREAGSCGIASSTSTTTFATASATA